MRLCMMPISIFVSRLGITDLVNKIKIDTNLIKLFHFEIYIILLNWCMRTGIYTVLIGIACVILMNFFSKI